MAISRIGGKLLKANLERDSDLAFNTDTLVVDYTNGRIGIGTASPSTTMEVDGTAKFNQLTITSNEIRTTDSNANIELIPNGTGEVQLKSNVKITQFLEFSTGVDANKILDEDDFISNDDDALATQQSIKAYVDAQVSSGGGASNGMEVPLDTPTDGSLTVDGAYQGWTTTTTVTDAIDDLNEVTENIRNNTFVKSVDFVANVTAGGEGLVVTLTITSEGNANRYDVTWGDGDTDTNLSTTSPSHTYDDRTGSPFSVTVRAYNNSGSGTGSEASKTRENYIIIYTADPVIGFAAYAAPTGGSPITQWDDGATVYFQNNTTNTDIVGATVQFTWDWGDTQSDDVVASDTDTGGSGGSRISHTFDTSTEQEVQRTVRLTLDTMSTADPAVIPRNTTNTYKIYDTHTPTVVLDDDSGVNEESSGGHVVTFTNNTESTIGNFSTYGITYQYQFGDGDTQTVNVGSGANGDTGGTIAHTYTLSSSDQANGIAQDYTGNLRVISNHTSSPFITGDFTVHVEPDVRANVSGVAVTTSDASGDNNRTIYDHTDYNGSVRSIVRATNTTQNADDYVYDWDDTSADDTVTEDGVSAGSIGATIDHDYAGEGTGTYTLTLTANGTPDITAQTDTDTVNFVLKAVPSAPAALSTKSITLSTSSVGTNPRLASGFTDNSTSAPLSASADLSTSTARRMTSGNVVTSSVDNSHDGLSGTLSAVINGSADGTKTFTTATNETGTFTSLVVSQNVDYHNIDNSYPSYFYQTFDANISTTIAALSVGVNDMRLEHTSTGNTNYVAAMKDDLTASPTFGTIGSLSEGTGGTKRYISGIAYYNTGSPTVTASGITINDLVGQAYTDQSNIVEIDSGTNYESTSSNSISSGNYTYADIDGASTMLSSGIPVVNTGTGGTPYSIGDLSVSITSSSVRTVESIKVRARNVNGISSYSEYTTKLQVHTASQSGIVEQSIPVDDTLGDGTFTDDAVRIFDFSADTTDTPSYNSATNFYTNSLYSESSDPGVSGTKEATIRLGILQHDVTDYSTGFLPVGPNRSGDTGTQYFTFAFRRRVAANFRIIMQSSSGVAGVWYAVPGTNIDDSSGLNGWVESTSQYAGVGLPGTDTGNGGNGFAGGAFTGSDVIPTNTSLSSSDEYQMTLGTENMSNATGNVVLVRIALTSGQSVSSISIGDT